MMNKFGHAGVATALWFWLSICDAATPLAVFDHSTNESGIQSVTADAGDTITVTINNTCPDLFTYAQKPLVLTKKPAPPPEGASCPSAKESYAQRVCKLTSTSVFVIHDNKYGGYQLSIARKPPALEGVPIVGVSEADYESGWKAYEARYSELQSDRSKSCDTIRDEVFAAATDKIKKTELRDVSETIVVSAKANYIEFAGGITVSNLTDPKFALGPNPSGTAGAPQVIVKDTSAEDRKRLGFAGFLHVHDPNCTGGWARVCDHAALSLGLGISTSNNVSLFVGPSFRLAGQWFVTAGYNWGSVDRLPNGEKVGQPPTTANALSNLSSRTAGAFFFSFSYAFLNPGTDFFKKPFANNQADTKTPKPAGQ